MAHPAPFIIRTPPPSPKKTAKKLGVSPSRFIHVNQLVDRVVEEGAVQRDYTRGWKAAKKKVAKRRSPRKK